MAHGNTYAEGRRDGVYVALRIILMSRPGSKEARNYQQALCAAILSGEPKREEMKAQLCREKLWPFV